MFDHIFLDAIDHPNMPFHVKETLEKMGDENIIKLQLGRIPVQEVVRKIGDFLSMHKFSDAALELGYDELWHNYLLITLANNVEYKVVTGLVQNAATIKPVLQYVLEKGPRVLLHPAVDPSLFIHIYDIPLDSDSLTTNKLMTTALNQDENFFTFDASKTNTCQSFVQHVLDSNDLTKNIVDEETLLAIKPQNTEALVAALGSYRGISKMITDMAADVDKLIHDKKIVWAPEMTWNMFNKRHPH